MNLLTLLADPKVQVEVCAAGRKIASPACAATASVWLQRAGVFRQGEYYPWTSDLIRELQRRGWKRVEVADIQPGDLLVSADLNRNGAPDHVMFMAVDQSGVKPGFMRVNDNNNRGKPYIRNIGRGKRTPLAYALRPS